LAVKRNVHRTRMIRVFYAERCEWQGCKEGHGPHSKVSLCAPNAVLHVFWCWYWILL